MQTSNKHELGYETWLLAVGILAPALFLLFVAFILMVPINNFFQANGTIQYRGEQTLVSEVEGVVSEIYVQDQAKIKRNQPILKVVNEDRQGSVKSLQFKTAMLATQLAQLEKLKESGSLDQGPVDAKRLELLQAEQEKLLLGRTAVEATADGYFNFLNPPKNLVGTYIHKGDVIGYIYKSEEKEVDVTLPTSWVDRFDSSTGVRVYYRSPLSYLSRNVAASIETIHANKNESRFQVTCRLHESLEEMKNFRPGTLVKVSFLVNSTSVFQEIFGFDPYGIFMTRLADWQASRSRNSPRNRP